jgi:hypothetical protein
MFMLLLSGGIYVLLDQAGIAVPDRTGPLFILAMMILIAAIGKPAASASRGSTWCCAISISRPDTCRPTAEIRTDRAR